LRQARIVVYRGPAACGGYAEAVKEAIEGLGPEADESWLQDAGIPANLSPRQDPFKRLFDALAS